MSARFKPVVSMFTIAANLLRVRIAALLAVLLLTPAQARIAFWGGDCYGLEESAPGPIRLVALAASETFCLGLRANGTVQAWGPNFSGETDIPPGLWDSVAIAAGSVHGLALRADGRVVAWGDDSTGQATVPPGLSDVTGVVIADLVNFAITSIASVNGELLAGRFADRTRTTTRTNAFLLSRPARCAGPDFHELAGPRQNAACNLASTFCCRPPGPHGKPPGARCRTPSSDAALRHCSLSPKVLMRPTRGETVS